MFATRGQAASYAAALTTQPIWLGEGPSLWLEVWSVSATSDAEVQLPMGSGTSHCQCAEVGVESWVVQIRRKAPYWLVPRSKSSKKVL